MTNREEGVDEFEQWLRTECFQAPPAHAYDLALSAWKAALKSAAPAEKPQAEPVANRDKDQHKLALSLVHSIPELASLLYDMNLLPEQIQRGSKKYDQMIVVALHFKHIQDRLSTSPPK